MQHGSGAAVDLLRAVRLLLADEGVGKEQQQLLPVAAVAVLLCVSFP